MLDSPNFLVNTCNMMYNGTTKVKDDTAPFKTAVNTFNLLSGSPPVKDLIPGFTIDKISRLSEMSMVSVRACLRSHYRNVQVGLVTIVHGIFKRKVYTDLVSFMSCIVRTTKDEQRRIRCRVLFSTEPDRTAVQRFPDSIVYSSRVYAKRRRSTQCTLDQGHQVLSLPHHWRKLRDGHRCN